MSLAERRKRLQELKEQEKNGTSTASMTTTRVSDYRSERSKRLAEIKQAEQQDRLTSLSSELTSRIDTWFKNNENYVNNYKSRFSGVTGSYTDPYDSDISNWVSTVTTQKSNFDTEAASIKSIIEENKDYLNSDWVNEVFSAFDSASKVQSDIVGASNSFGEYWSQWESPEAYAEWAGAVAEREKLLSVDLTSSANDIAVLENVYNAVKHAESEIQRLESEKQMLNLAAAKGSADARAQLEANEKQIAAHKQTLQEADAKYYSKDNLSALLSSKKAEYTTAERAQNAAKLASVADANSELYDPNFDAYSELGKAISYESVGGSKKQNGITVYDDLKAATLALNEYYAGEELFTKDMLVPGKGISGYIQGLKGISEYNSENIKVVDTFREMNENEFATLAYYLKKDEENGTDLAEQYVESIRETLNTRVAVDIAEAKKDNLALQYVFAAEAGLDQFYQGRDAWFADEDYIVPSATQIASGMIREDLAETGKQIEWLGGVSLGQIGYDAINTTANMLPSILASTAVNMAVPGAGTVVGAGVLGMSAGGNARAEMLNLGYSKEQATSYGLMVGVAEAGMEYLLGHIPGLSKGDGVFSTLGTKVATKIDNAISRVAIALGDKGVEILQMVAGKAIGAVGGALDEALEEGLQTIIEPWLKEAATSVDWDDPKVDEILYSSLLGAITSFGFSAGETVLQSVSSPIRQNAEAKQNLGAYQSEIAAEAVALNPNSKFAQNMQAKVEGGKDLSGAQLNRLVKNYESSLSKNDADKIKSATVSRLTELGESGDVEVIASALTKQLTGKTLSIAERTALKKSTFGQRVANELNADNIRSGGYTSAWAENLGTDRVNVKEYNRGLMESEDAPKRVALPKSASSVAVKNAKGKTVRAEIKGVEVNGKQEVFTLTNGETVKRGDVAFQSEDAKLVADTAVERVSRVEGFTDEAATAMIKGYDGSVGAARYITLFDEAYELGAADKPSSNLTRVMNGGLGESAAYAAYVLGKESTKNVESVLKTESKNGIINTNNNSEAENESGESIHLRDSGERAGGKNTGRQISRVESSTGQAESRGENTRNVADGEAARFVNEGREVKVADLGILGGSSEHTVRLVDQANETSSMKEARAAAEARGLKVKFFVGDNLTIKGKDGKWFAARAFIKGEYVFIRADHPKYTSDQLMRHELGHDMIAKGEVDIDAVRERLIEAVGKDKIDEVAEAYADAYDGSGLSAEEVWEECICDSLGDMNIFAGKDVVNDLLMADMIPEINRAANEGKSPTQMRGSPEGKASRDTNRYTEKEYRDFGWARANDVISASESEDLRSKFAAIVSGQAIAPKTKSGEYMIAIGEDVNNKIAYMKGTITDPVITRVLEIDEYNETKLDEKRRETYALEGRGIQRKTGGIFHVNTSASFRGTEHQQRNSRQGERHNNQLNSQRSGSGKTAYRFEAKFDDDGNEVSRKYSSPEEAKTSGKVSDAKFSIEFADDIANKQRQFAADGLSRISSEELEKAIADTAHMVSEMKPYANILPQDKVGKTLVKNGSYDVSVENTTVCIRTLAYNSFVDMVSEKVGRPLTQMESFLVSQKLYDIAKEPQCLYCYVSLDRKAFNEMVIRYTEQRDAAIAAYEAAGKPKLPSSFNAEWTLFKEFLAGRKPTKNMWDRYVGWINAYNKGDRLVSLSDISTEAKRLELVEGGGDIASQVKDILKYAQSASWAKKQTQYVAYYDEILKLKPAVIRNLNNHYGMRWYSFSDYSGAFIVENMQQITDAAIRGLKGLSYTKDTDFAEIFAPTGMNINISVYAKKTADGGYEIDAKQSADIQKAIELRKEYPNVGIVVVATDKAGVEWALAQEWSDVVIPFHTVRTGADVAEFYNWEIFNAEQNDTVSDQNLWDAYTRDVGKKKASKMVYPSEHQNNRETYLSICEKRGLTPRFKSFLENPNYMKLVNETRQSEGQTSPLKAKYNLEAAERSFDKFVEKGGYYEGWYNDGIDVDGEADIVAEDVRAGRRANEVGYGRQDVNFEDVAKGRRVNREHGKASRELDFLDFMEQQTDREVLANAFESVAQNDVEKAKLKDYRENIDRLNAEEEKLMKLRAEIKELSFAKGARDISKIAELRQEAEKTANRIGIYDKRLLTLEASKPLRAVLEREKQKTYNRAKAEARADLDAYRERALMKQEALKTRYQESKARGVEGRKKTEVRHKIKGIVGELDTLLRNPTSKKHIKEELRRGVAEALMAFNMDTIGAEERLAEINKKLQNESDPYEIAHLLESYNRIKNQDANLKEKLEKLNTAYEKIKDSDDIELNLAYQEVIQNSIKAVSEKVGDTSIRDMTLEQLEMVYDLFKMIRHTIRDANKAFKAKKALTITQMSEAANQEIRTVAGQPYQRNVVSATAQRMGWSLLKPYVAFRTIGSDVFTDLYRELRNGEDTFYTDVKESIDFVEEQYKKHGFKDWDMKETKTFKSKSGKEFELTLEQMMTLYAYSKREQAHAHIMEGGIVFEDALVVKKNKLGVPIKYEVTTKDAFNLSVDTFTQIASTLTEEQKAFVDEMQAYLSDTMGAKGNEISMQLLGVKLFKEKFYLPIKSSQYYMNFKAEEAGEVKLRSPAFSKETVHHANNPIVLHNFTDLWAEHINDMSMYHSFVLALEDFTRVYNYKTKTDANVETMDTKATLETAYPGVTKYINKFLKDMNGGVRSETVGFAEKMTSLAKKGAVLGSASVTIQQPSAIMRAMAYINPKYFVGEKVSKGNHKEKWEELKKYAPIAGIKEMGRFDVGMGASTTDLIKADKNFLEKAEDVLSLPPAFMDEVTWLTIWNAVKRETAHNYPKLATSSEEFKQLAGERFTDVISLSQVYDSVFSRSDLMRNKSWIAKSLTAFMAEPTTTLNMLWDSCVQGKRTGGKKGFATQAATGGAIFASIVFNSILKSFVTAMRDDDEDESYIEKYFEHLASELKDNLTPFNIIPFAKDIWSIFKGYDVERMDLILFSDLKDAIDAFDSKNKTLYDKWSGLIGAIAALRGIPVKNIERDVRALFNTIFGKREHTTLEGWLYAIEKGWTGDEKSNGQQLYEAMLKGDTKHIERVKARFEDQKDIEAAVYKALKENDVRVKEAAKARNNGDIAGYTEIAKEIVGEGIFSQDNVVAAINSEIRAFSSKISEAASAKLAGEAKEYKDILDKLIETYKGVYTREEIEDAIAKSEPKESTDSDEIKSIYVVEDFYKAVRGNDIATAYIVREDIINVAIDNGKSRKAAESDFEESIAKYVGNRYKEGLIGDDDAARILTEFGGKTEDEASSSIRYWAFKAENPEYADLSESAVNKYYDGAYKDGELHGKSAQSYGISLDIYAEYIRGKAGLSLKEDIMYIINTLPLTKEQKDALYYLNTNWSKNEIRKAPWR